MQRRDFFKLVGLASTPLAAGCNKVGSKKLVASIMWPAEGVIPGEPRYVNTTCTECPAQCGAAVRVVDGRPKKLEGLADHPINRGALCLRGQASLTRLYDPQRIPQPLRRQGDALQPTTWDAALTEIAQALKSGRDNVYLSGRTTGSLAALIDAFCEQTSTRRAPEWEPLGGAALRTANKLAFGIDAAPEYRIDRADFLLTIGADIVETFDNPVALGRRLGEAKEKDGFTWTHVEPHVSLTGLQANRRLVIRPGGESTLLAQLLRGLPAYSSLSPDIRDVVDQLVADDTGIDERELQSLTDALRRARHPLLIAGGVSTAQESGLTVGLLAALLHSVAGMSGDTLEFPASATDRQPATIADMQRLVQGLNGGQVGVLLVTRTNPAATLAPAVGFQAAIGGAALRVGMGVMMDATLAQCDIVLPLSHALETWGDAEPSSGVRNVIQPALGARWDTRSEGDVLLELMRRCGATAPANDFHDYLGDRWVETIGEDAIQQFVAAGFTTSPPSPAAPELQEASVVQGLRAAPRAASTSGPVLIAMPAVRWGDGRSRDLELLNEIPDPLTTITYGDQWLSISQQSAKALNVADGDHVSLTAGEYNIQLPVKVQPLLPENVYTVHQGMLPDLPLPLTPGAPEQNWVVPDVNVQRVRGHTDLPILAGAFSNEGRGIIPVSGIARETNHGSHDHAAEEHGHEGEHAERHEIGQFRTMDIYPQREHPDYRWSMTVDLDRCVGCSACVGACYIENNVPCVGLAEHLKGREMSWIRIEPRYDEQVTFTPMMCQQCTNAPCETVCPVFATYHNPEGLNVQVYNRCIGTRYCANNCPYKVRRFNWFKHRWPSPLDEMLNPDIIARGKGIMEKCTFCMQRIRAARDKAKDEGRKILDGEVVPACAQTCPTSAITFGNIQDEQSQVSRIVENDDRAFRILEEVQTQPAVYYLEKRRVKA